MYEPYLTDESELLHLRTDFRRMENAAEKISLSMNAGARAIEQNKKLHGVYYCIDPLGETKEIAYLEAATVLRQNADAIEQLIAENAKLKAERDAAMRTMPHDCNTCSKDCNITIAHKALFTKRCDEWEWKGVKEEEK